MKVLKRTFAAVIFVGGAMTAFAQQMPPIPTDPNVRIGKLENGLTYYIRHNELPDNQADFYIAQKVGSILEEDNQRGLAHFLEHMCFNGSGRLLHCTESRFYPGRRQPAWSGALPGAHVFQRDHSLPRQPAS